MKPVELPPTPERYTNPTMGEPPIFLWRTKMSRVSFVALLSSLFAVPAFAMPADHDMDGDGLASLAELQTKYPEVSDDLFLEIDANADGFINDDELVAAVDAELLPGPAGDQ
jgi:hypothetical protein